MGCIVRLNRNGEYWLARWSINGRRGGKSLGSTRELSRRSAEALCRQLQAELAVDAAPGRAPRLSVWCEQYKRLRTNLSSETMKLVDQTTRYLQEYFKLDPPIDRIARVDAAEWRAALHRGELHRANVYPKPDELAKPATRARKYRQHVDAARPLSEATVAKHVRTAKRMFREAGPDGLRLIPADPFKPLSGKAPDIDKSWSTVTPVDMTKILAECPNWSWKMLFALCRYAGLRRGECLRLQWQDVIWAENKLIVNARVKRGTKKRTRVCPIEPARLPTGLLALLQEAHAAAAPGSTHVCPGIDKSTTSQHAKRILQRAGKVYGDPFHTLRRNREMELAAVYPMHVFAEWQGHSPEVAQKYYLRVDESLYDPPKPAQKLAQRGGKARRKTS